MDMQPFKKAPEDDCVEAEIVSGPGARENAGGGRPEERREKAEDYDAPRPEPAGPFSATGRIRRPFGGGGEPVNIPFYGLFLRLKFIFIAAILLASFGLIVLGLILTSTFIGAIIGVPLLILGGFLLWLLFKLLTFGQKSQPIIFRRF